jgi:hypothetical protein
MSSPLPNSSELKSLEMSGELRKLRYVQLPRTGYFSSTGGKDIKGDSMVRTTFKLGG